MTLNTHTYIIQFLPVSQQPPRSPRHHPPLPSPSFPIVVVTTAPSLSSHRLALLYAFRTRVILFSTSQAVCTSVRVSCIWCMYVRVGVPNGFVAAAVTLKLALNLFLLHLRNSIHGIPLCIFRCVLSDTNHFIPFTLFFSSIRFPSLSSFLPYSFLSISM